MKSLRTSKLSRMAVSVAVLALLASSCAEAAQDDFPVEIAVADESDSGDDGPVRVDPSCDDDAPDKSFAPDETSLQATSPDIEEIKAHGKLKVGIAQDTLLFGFLDPTSDDIEGFDVEMARLVAAALFGDPDSIELIPIQSSERIGKLQSGEVDLVAKTMTITCERWADINFSTIYYDAAQRLLVRKGSGIEEIEDFEPLANEEARICAEAQTTSIANIEAKGYLTPVPVDSIAECLVLFQQASVVGISTDDTILAGLAAQDPSAEVVGDDISNEPYGLGTRKEDVEFTKFVNAVLEQAREDGSWQTAYDKWLAELLDDPEGPPQAPPSASYR